MMHCGIPVLNPSSVQDYLDFGIYGWALSRYSGCWVGFKCLTDTIESSGSVSVAPDPLIVGNAADIYETGEHTLAQAPQIEGADGGDKQGDNK